MSGIAKSHKRGLAGELQRHHKNTEKVNMHGRHAIFQKRRITVKYMDEGVREEKDQRPDHQCKYDAGDGHEPDRRLYPVIFPGSVVKTHHGLAAVRQSVDRNI